MSYSPLVSIVIPCFNVEGYINDCIESAISQTYESIEIICVDNGSTDATIDILQEFEQREVITLLHEKAKGAPAARNFGWKASQGEWIQFLDADDLLLPDKIAHQIALISTESSTPFIASRTSKMNLSNSIRTDWQVMDNPWHGLLQNRLGITSANLFSRHYLDKVNGWNEDMKSSQEYDLMFRMMKISDNVVIDNLESLSIIQNRAEGSISSESITANKHRFLKLMATIGEYLKREKPEVYITLDEGFFEEMFVRIRLNTIEGFPDSALYYDQLMPDRFKPAKGVYTPLWFRLVNSLLGFSAADAVHRWRL